MGKHDKNEWCDDRGFPYRLGRVIEGMTCYLCPKCGETHCHGSSGGVRAAHCNNDRTVHVVAVEGLDGYLASHEVGEIEGALRRAILALEYAKNMMNRHDDDPVSRVFEELIGNIKEVGGGDNLGIINLLDRDKPDLDSPFFVDDEAFRDELLSQVFIEGVVRKDVWFQMYGEHLERE